MYISVSPAPLPGFASICPLMGNTAIDVNLARSQAALVSLSLVLGCALLFVSLNPF